MQISERDFGRTTDGSPVALIPAAGAAGLEVSASAYGATLVSVVCPDKNGELGEITLGFDTVDGYLGEHPYFGATVGRYANRIGDAAFTVDGKMYRLAKNDGKNHLHGGLVGFNRALWQYSVSNENGVARIRFDHTSPDGGEGYPGDLEVAVTFVVTDDNLLRFEYRAIAGAKTPVNFTNHAYWNLEAPGTDVRDHVLALNARNYLANDEELIPNGALNSVTRTPYDFTSAKSIRSDFDEAGGYDTNFVIDGTIGEMRDVAEVYAPVSGRRMAVRTDQAAVQLYTANKLTEITGHDGTVYRTFGALCLETGGYNNAVNIASFPSPFIDSGERYTHNTEHRFSVT